MGVLSNLEPASVFYYFEDTLVIFRASRTFPCSICSSSMIKQKSPAMTAGDFRRILCSYWALSIIPLKVASSIP